MFKFVILIIFALLLCADFMVAVWKKEKVLSEIIIRSFMLVSFIYLCKWF
jgi:hypothetical protein